MKIEAVWGTHFHISWFCWSTCIDTKEKGNSEMTYSNGEEEVSL